MSVCTAGVKIIFRVGLVLLKCMLGSQEKLKACQGQYETMELLRSIEPQYMQEAFLVQEVSSTHTLMCCTPFSTQNIFKHGLIMKHIHIYFLKDTTH